MLGTPSSLFLYVLVDVLSGLGVGRGEILLVPFLCRAIYLHLTALHSFIYLKEDSVIFLEIAAGSSRSM